MGDVVDLTLSDSDEDVPGLQEAQQVAAAVQKQATTAAAPEAASPSAVAEEDQHARKRIMDFARGKAAQFSKAGANTATEAAAAAASGEGLHTADDGTAGGGGAAKRVKLTSPQAAGVPDADGTTADLEPAAANAAEARAVSDATTAGGGSASAGTSPAEADGAFGNADLRALHVARMQRQQQQQQQQQQQDAAPGSTPAASPAAAAASKAAAASPPPAAAAAAGAATAGGSTRRRSRSPTAARNGAKPADGSAAAPAAAGANGGVSSISLLTYNVWFKEEVAVLERMIGLSDIVRSAGLPTFICLQEVTPLILEILVNMDWWEQYTPSPHPHNMTYFTLLLVKRSAADASHSEAAFSHREFSNTAMARGLRSARVSLAGRQLLVATTHLESPIPPHAFYTKERQQQMAEALRTLHADAAGNVLFAGDMNWEDKRDGAPPLPDSWVDAWATLQPGRPGVTYDAKNNPMLPFKGTPPLRLDRILCRLSDWRLGGIELVGTQQLPGVTYTHRLRNGGSKELPVLPSDHFGLLLRLQPV